MDDIDRAQRTEQRLREQALKRVNNQKAPDNPSDYCIYCDDPIEEKRKKLIKNVRTCIDCQEELEAAQHG